MKLTPEDQLILWSVKIEPSTEELKKIDILLAQISDWDYLIKTIVDRGIAPLLYTKLPKLSNANLLPKAAATKLQQAYLITFSRSTVLYEHFRMVANAFAKFNIPIIALKGVYLSENLYQDIGLRQFSDIDLLVKPEDGTKAIAVLSDMGYKPMSFKVSEFVKKNTEVIHYDPMIYNGVSIELHTKLHKDREVYHVNQEHIWQNKMSVTINKIPAYSLGINDLLIHLCIHLDKHFISESVQFTCFNDITNYLEEFSKQIDWIEFVSLCKSYNCEKVVFKYLVLVHDYMNASMPENVYKKYSYCLTENDINIFLNLLGGKSANTIVKMYLLNLNSIKGIQNKSKYVFDLLFPPKEFMVQLYKIKHPSSVLFYYPYRYFIGLRGIFNHLFKIK